MTSREIESHTATTTERAETLAELEHSASLLWKLCQKREKGKPGPIFHVIGLEEADDESEGSLARIIIVRARRRAGHPRELQVRERFIPTSTLRSPTKLLEYLLTVGSKNEPQTKMLRVRRKWQAQAVSYPAGLPREAYEPVPAPSIDICLQSHSLKTKQDPPQPAPNPTILDLITARNLVGEAALGLRPGSNNFVGTFSKN